MTNSSGHLWWQTGVIYQVYPRSFRDSSGNGVGDLPGIVEGLEYLATTLGVDALWLSPFYPSPMADFGYDVSDYTGVDPLFGTLVDFDRLVSRAHQLGLRMIVDLVPNHTSDQHPWFVKSRSSRENARRDWYIWADPNPDGSLPNNWLSVFGGPAWEWDARTAQYYLHSFLREQPDLNWRNPAVKEAMFDVTRFWLERGVDGFRIDVAHYIMKDPELRDNPPNPSRAKSLHRPLGDYDSQFHIHDLNHPDAHGVYREFRQLLDAYSEERARMAVGEVHIFDLAQWATYFGRDLDELHMPFNFHLLNTPWQARAVRDLVEALERTLPPGAWPNYVLGNHDEPRLASRYGRAQARVAAMLLLTLRGTPTLYYGDEIGMADVPIPAEQQQDPWGIRVPGLGRDPCRTPMQWTPGPNAGFSSPETRGLWLPLAADYEQINVEREMEEPTSILNLYRKLLAYRRATPALQWGSYKTLENLSADCYTFRRQAGGQRVLVALNFSGEDQSISLPGRGGGTIVISTHLDREGKVDLDDLGLRADEGLIVEPA
jgi:alpha-glucosidase